MNLSNLTLCWVHLSCLQRSSSSEESPVQIQLTAQLCEHILWELFRCHKLTLPLLLLLSHLHYRDITIHFITSLIGFILYSSLSFPPPFHQITDPRFHWKVWWWWIDCDTYLLYNTMSGRHMWSLGTCSIWTFPYSAGFHLSL